MTDFENKVLQFSTALMDVYRDDSDRELSSFGKMEVNSDDLTEDFTAMLYAMSTLYAKITGENDDIIDFTYILNKLAIQKIMEVNENGTLDLIDKD